MEIQQDKNSIRKKGEESEISSGQGNPDSKRSGPEREEDEIDENTALGRVNRYHDNAVAENKVATSLDDDE